MIRFGGALAALVLMALPLAAAEMRTFEAANGSVEIPADPQRIVSLHDLSITLPLVEFGGVDRIVGSHGRVDDAGAPYIRTVNILYDVDYDNTDIEFIGVFNETDLEKIALLEPDLIIGRAGNDDKLLENLNKIAPTVLIDVAGLDYFGRMHAVADAANLTAEYDRRLALYQEQVTESRRLIRNAPDISAAIIQPWPKDGYINGAKNYYALSQVLDDIGFTKPKVIADITDTSGDAEFSPEFLPELDADFAFATYEVTAEDQSSPQLIRDAFNALIPGFCGIVHFCRENQLIILPRSPIYASSFRSLEIANDYVLSHVAGREFVPFAKN